MNAHTKRMCQQPRCRGRKPAILAKPIVVQPDSSDTGLTNCEPTVQTLMSGPKGGVLGGSSIENQVAQLGHSYLLIRQRQALVATIGRVQGNRQLQRVIAYLRENNGEQKYTLIPFSSFSCEAL